MHSSKKSYNEYLDRPDLGLLLLRLFLGSRLLYGVVDNVVSWERMQEFALFLEQHHFPLPTISAIISVYLQLLGALLILLGYKTRVAAFLLSLNFLVALLAVHLANSDSIEGMTPALAMLFSSLTLLLTGPGRHSIDQKGQF